MRANTLLKQKKEIIEKLKSIGVTRVEIEYDGSGDSGDIGSIVAYGKSKKPEVKPKPSPDEDHAPVEETPADQVDIKNEKMTITKREGVFKIATGKTTDKITEEEGSLPDACENLASDYLENLGIDWYNNEGGFGKIIIDVEANVVKAEHNTRVSSSEYEEHSI